MANIFSKAGKAFGAAGSLLSSASAPSKSTTPPNYSSGSGNTSGGAGGGSSATPAPIDNMELAQKYGFTKSLMDSSPELARLFQQAVQGQWTPDKFQAMLRNTQWYQGMSDNKRKMLTLQFTDPATYQANWSKTYDHVQQLAASMGADPNDWRMLDPVTANMFYEGWTDERTRTELGKHITFGNNGIAGGEAGRIQQEIASYSYSMGIKNSDDWMRSKVMSIMSGQATDQDAKSEILGQAIAQFPSYEKELRGGMTMHDVAQPYMQSMSQILELNPGSVSLFDPTITKALSYRDPSGSGAAQPLWQFQNELRQDDRWKQTQNAQDTAMGVTKSILQTFGEVKF
jgi:hypothetical protein